MSQTLLLKIKGLWTNLNEFSETPDGGLAEATNIIISQDSVAECRRGYLTAFTVPGSSLVDRLNEFMGDLIVHYGTTLAVWQGTIGTAPAPFTGSYSNPTSTATMKFAQQNQNLYFTTSLGVYKLDALSNEPQLSGIAPGLDIEAATSGSSGFLTTQSSVAYRMLWGYKDANSNLILGAPSQRVQLDNPSTTISVNASVTFTVPSGITVNDFYQVYRSDQIAFTGTTPNTPDDNMQLVYEGNPTSAQITAKQVTITDITPDSLRGAALYTNATQEGILQANDQPPFCIDICPFKNCMFFLNTSDYQNFSVSLLSAGGTGGVQIGDTITIGANTFTSISGTPTAGSNNYQLYTSGSPSQNVNQTAINLVEAINQSTTNTTIYAYYVSTTTSLPGQIYLANRSYASSAFSLTVSGNGASWSPTLPTSGTSVISTNTAYLNGLMYSKQQEPEAVPSQNIFFPGSANQAGYRILALRDSLFILKQDGVFRLSGTSPADFVIDTLDNTVFITCPDTAVALNNCVYALTTQGVAQITDSGVSIISRPIEDQLNQIIGTVGPTAMAKYAYGVSYESERQYKLYLPTAANATSATICYVYNYFTKTWVVEDRAQTCGWVLSSNNKIYVGNTPAFTVSQERKDYEYTDYTDESIAVTVVSSSGVNVVLSSAANVSVGDVLFQSTAISSEVIAVNPASNALTVSSVVSWSTGSSQILKSIPCTLQWLPTSGQNPGMLKQYSEGVLIFKSSPFSLAMISYLSDISGSFDTVTLSGTSAQGWGFFPWGLSIWGGVVRPGTSRHYIPRDKQRCTLLTPQFFTQSGWSNFQLEGLSLQYRVISGRTSR